jgi:hypothetical protein
LRITHIIFSVKKEISMAMSSTKLMSATDLNRDGMELSENVVLLPPAMGIEPTLQLDQGMEVRHTANGKLVTVGKCVTPAGQRLTAEFQAQQMEGVDKFCANLLRTMPTGALAFQRVVLIHIHFRPGFRPGLLQTMMYHGTSPVYVIPEGARMKVPPAIERMCPVQSLERMEPEDLRYDILDRHIRAHGANYIPQGVRVVMVELLGMISAVTKFAPVNGAEVESGAVNQVGWDDAAETGAGKEVYPRPAYSPVSRAPESVPRPN